jgi:hypothetical protein
MNLSTTCILVFVLAVAPQALADSIPLVRAQASDYVIFCDLAAPSSVAHAAAELQAYLFRVSGAKLSIVHVPSKKMISLGDNAASREAGLSAASMPWEGFQIVTKKAGVFILGRDTADDELTPGGGSSSGTLNGTYEFIERFLGVRWLLPGDHGDFVPKSGNITIPETDISDAPAFLNRRLPYTQERRPDVKRWWRQQRLGWSLYLTHGHNWRHSIPATHFDTHPDWFAERGGVRVPPTGRYKLCTTNPGLVSAFADAAITYFDQHPDATCYSLSPSDSAGYCECEDCSALYETDPNGNRSVTPAMLTFYNDVAKLVAKKYPDKILAGYVYAAYVFPPKNPIVLAPNLFLVWAPSFDYGFTLARPALRQQWDDLLRQWTQSTKNISYYDLPVNIETETGALNPPGLEILKFIYPRLKAADVKGVYVYGIEAWGRAAPLNYLLAKLAWNPEADVEALFDEFCAKAYGAGGDDINRMLRLLDVEVARHYQAYPAARYQLTTDMMQDVYAKNLPQLERLYLVAKSKVRDPDAQARLKMIGDNLNVMHWTLRQYRMLNAPEESSFYLSDADFFQFLSQNRGSLALHPIAATSPPAYVKKKLSVAPPEKLAHTDSTQPFRLRGDQHLVLCPDGTGPVELRFSRIATRGKLVTYNLYDADGTEVKSGLMGADMPIELAATSSPYYHLVISAGTASFMVQANGVAWSVDGGLSDQGLHLLGPATPVYFQVPDGTRRFHLSLEAAAPGETAIATLHAPDGRQISEFDCMKISVDRKSVEVATQQTGWWKLIIKQAPSGALDDVWVKQGDELSGYFSLVPAQALGTRTSDHIVKQKNK